MGMLFIKDGLVDPAIVSVDSSLLKAKGHVWHKSSMKKNEVPRSGIDTDARWGFSRTKGWVFGYKMHLACSTGSLIVPLSADFTTASITDNKMYESITSSLPTGMVMKSSQYSPIHHNRRNDNKCQIVLCILLISDPGSVEPILQPGKESLHNIARLAV